METFEVVYPLGGGESAGLFRWHSDCRGQKTRRDFGSMGAETILAQLYGRMTLDGVHPVRAGRKRKNKKFENTSCISFRTVIIYLLSLRGATKQKIRVWRSLVSRLNGVQEALSSNLNTELENRLKSLRFQAIFLCIPSARRQELVHWLHGDTKHGLRKMLNFVCRNVEPFTGRKIPVKISGTRGGSTMNLRLNISPGCASATP